MGPKMEVNRESEIVMKVQVKQENEIFLGDTQEKHMACTSNREDLNIEMDTPKLVERTKGVKECEDVEVNIMDNRNFGGSNMFELEYQDTTESSSSFGNSASEAEDVAASSNAEVESDLHNDSTSASAFDGLGDMFRMRKKKLTSHWRSFIHPLMWRCKWVELQMKNLQTQAEKYDGKLADYKQRKQYQQDNVSGERFCSKTRPFSSSNQTDKVMRRKRRKRTEDTLDTATYTSHHNLFSYYDNRMSAHDSALDDGLGDLGNVNGLDEFRVNDEMLLLESRGSDNSPEEILRSIGVLQSQIIKMKTRLDKVSRENTAKFSSADNLSLLLPCNDFMSSDWNPTSPNNSDKLQSGSSNIASQVSSEYKMGDVKPECAVSSHGKLTHPPDIIESSDHAHIRDGYKSTGNGILIDSERMQAGGEFQMNSQTVKEEMHTIEEMKIQPAELPGPPKDGKEGTEPPVLNEPDLPVDDQPAPKIRSVAKRTAPKRKRRKGRRKITAHKRSRKP